MKIKDIYNFLNTIAPFDSSLDWDNSGLLIGDKNSNLSSALIALDVTSSIVKESIERGSNLIISHHPVIFNPLEKILSNSLVYQLIQNNINVISLHTNLDMAEGGVNDTLAKIFGLYNLSPLSIEPPNSLPLGVIGDLPTELLIEGFVLLVKDKLGCDRIKFVSGDKSIKKLALCGGSGGNLISQAIRKGADAFVTSEIKHNIWIEAKASGLTLIDAGHFHTENVIVPELHKLLTDEFHNDKNKFHIATNNISNVRYL